jgi:hypothetical protein
MIVWWPRRFVLHTEAINSPECIMTDEGKRYVIQTEAGSYRLINRWHRQFDSKYHNRRIGIVAIGHGRIRNCSQQRQN